MNTTNTTVTVLLTFLNALFMLFVGFVKFIGGMRHYLSPLAGFFELVGATIVAASCVSRLLGPLLGSVDRGSVYSRKDYGVGTGWCEKMGEFLVRVNGGGDVNSDVRYSKLYKERNVIQNDERKRGKKDDEVRVFHEGLIR